ncbi:unnamed protein product [Chondrus crispus]|uniref:Uncharacterized protein n=1 Tax=Chondrus crispus TaxID=2769 RepID=R7QN06_CHOCR|nr:unnamed protein product [Chondrus crispus]CDF38765.1 unnamed protein product [Chondrus crispus]|eukprot:XP_005718670.1 unnamed protein product [Chondrus crispus]
MTQGIWETRRLCWEGWGCTAWDGMKWLVRKSCAMDSEAAEHGKGLQQIRREEWFVSTLDEGGKPSR